VKQVINLRDMWRENKQIKEQLKIYDETLSRTINALIAAWEENDRLRQIAEPTEAEIEAFWRNIQQMRKPVYEDWTEEVQHDD